MLQTKTLNELALDEASKIRKEVATENLSFAERASLTEEEVQMFLGIDGNQKPLSSVTADKEFVRFQKLMDTRPLKLKQQWVQKMDEFTDPITGKKRREAVFDVTRKITRGPNKGNEGPPKPVPESVVKSLTGEGITKITPRLVSKFITILDKTGNPEAYKPNEVYSVIVEKPIWSKTDLKKVLEDIPGRSKSKRNLINTNTGQEVMVELETLVQKHKFTTNKNGIFECTGTKDSVYQVIPTDELGNEFQLKSKKGETVTLGRRFEILDNSLGVRINGPIEEVRKATRAVIDAGIIKDFTVEWTPPAERTCGTDEHEEYQRKLGGAVECLNVDSKTGTRIDEQEWDIGGKKYSVDKNDRNTGAFCSDSIFIYMKPVIKDPVAREIYEKLERTERSATKKASRKST